MYKIILDLNYDQRKVINFFFSSVLKSDYYGSFLSSKKRKKIQWMEQTNNLIFLNLDDTSIVAAGRDIYNRTLVLLSKDSLIV
jgi:hypothetical protein